MLVDPVATGLDAAFGGEGFSSGDFTVEEL
jgi:hypothetical protein